MTGGAFAALPLRQTLAPAPVDVVLGHGLGRFIGGPGVFRGMAGGPDVLQKCDDRLIILRAGSGRDIDRLAAVVVDLRKDRLVAAAVVAHGLNSCIGHGKFKITLDRAGGLLQLLTGLSQKIRVGVGGLQKHHRVAQLVARGQRQRVVLRHDGLLPLVLVIDDSHAVVAVAGGVVRLGACHKAVAAVEVEHHILKAAPGQGQGSQRGEGRSDPFFHKSVPFYNSIMA